MRGFLTRSRPDVGAHFRPVAAALSLVVTLAACGRAQAADKQFQEAVRLYQSGDQAGAAKDFLAAARAGDVRAQLQIGWQYEKGVGVPQSYADAATWYRKAADQGNARAMKNLGQLYENGQGVPEDWVEAAKWYQKSASLGAPEGQAALARAYQFGIGVPQNRQKSIEWDQRAAAQGDEESAYFARWLSDPTNNIGFRNEYEQGLVLAGRLRFGGALIGGDPTGLLFRNATERLGWLVLQRKTLDAQEAESMWSIRRMEYDRCRREQRGGCIDPGPRP